VPPHTLRHLAMAVFVAATLAVAWAMFRPEPPPQAFEQSDKFGHLAAFFVLALSGRLAFPRIPGPAFWLGFCVLAFGLEYLQGALRPLRYFSLADAAANWLGAGLAAGVWVWWKKRVARQLS